MAAGCYRLTENPGVCGCVGLVAVGVKRASPFRDLKKGQQTTQELARGIGPKKGAAQAAGYRVWMGLSFWDLTNPEPATWPNPGTSLRPARAFAPRGKGSAPGDPSH